MGNTEHGNLGYAEQHVVHFKEYANKTAREAASGLVIGDDHKVALQTDDHSLWILTAYGGPTWVSVSGLPSGTKMWFYQNTAPAGWTLDGTPSDDLLAVKGGSAAFDANGGTGAGTWTVAGLTKDAHTHTGPSHTHTGPSHTHGAGNYAGPNHTHTGPSHTHGNGTLAGPSHTHNLDNNMGVPSTTIAVQQGSGTTVANFHHRHLGVTVAAGTGAVTGSTAAGGTGATGADGTGAVTGTSAAGGTGETGAGGTGATGAQSDAGISSDATWRPKARLGIICTKD